MSRITRKILLVLVGLGFLVLGPSTVFHQRTEAQIKSPTTVFLAEVAVRMDAHLARAKSQGYNLSVKDGFISGGWLQQGENHWVKMFDIHLTQGSAWRFVAAGDADTHDLDLRITDNTGRVLAADDSLAREAVVDFVPRESQKYNVELRLFGSRNNLPCITLVAALNK